MLHHREVVDGARTIDLLEPEGDFTGAGGLVDEFDRRVRGLLSHGRRDIRVSCRLMTAIDSTGIAVLVEASSRAQQQRGRFVVDHEANEEMRRLLKSLGFGFGDDGSTDGTAGRPSPLDPPPRRNAPADAREPERGGGDDES